MQRLQAVWLELDQVRHDLALAAAHVTDHPSRQAESADEAEVAVRPHDYLRAYA